MNHSMGTLRISNDWRSTLGMGSSNIIFCLKQFALFASIKWKMAHLFFCYLDTHGWLHGKTHTQVTYKSNSMSILLLFTIHGLKSSQHYYRVHFDICSGRDCGFRWLENSWRWWHCCLIGFVGNASRHGSCGSQFCSLPLCSLWLSYSAVTSQIVITFMTILVNSTSFHTPTFDSSRKR